MARGAQARAAMKAAVTEALKTVGVLFIELNMKQRWAAPRAGQRIASRAFLDQIGELLEEVRRVVRTGRGFRVILDAEDGQFFVPHPLYRAVV
jgi:hypothetical protein